MWRRKVGWCGNSWVGGLSATTPSPCLAWGGLCNRLPSGYSLQSHCEREVPATTVWTSSPYPLSCSRMTVGFCISPSVPFFLHPTPILPPQSLCVVISKLVFPHFCGNILVSQSLRDPGMGTSGDGGGRSQVFWNPQHDTWPVWEHVYQAILPSPELLIPFRV